MNTCLHAAILLAEQSRVDIFTSGLRERRRLDTQDVVTGLLVLGAVVLVVWILSYLMTLQERRRPYVSPRRLFLELCKAHKLRWSQWWLLWRVARAQRLRDPALLFLAPERLESIRESPAFRKRAAELKRLREMLFAEPQGEAEGAPADESSHPAVPPAGTPLSPAAPVPLLDVPPWAPAASEDAEPSAV